MLLDDYLKQYSRVESIKLSWLIRKADTTMQKAIITLINKHKIDKEDKKVIRRYEKLCKLEMYDDFEVVMEKYKQLEW